MSKSKKKPSIQWKINRDDILCSYSGRFSILREEKEEDGEEIVSYILRDALSGVDYICPTLAYAREFAENVILSCEQAGDADDMQACINQMISEQTEAQNAVHKGFTLTNMVIAMLVFAVLATVGIYCYQRQVTNSRTMDAESKIESFEAIADTFLQKHREECLSGTAGVTALNKFMDTEDYITPNNDQYANGDVNADGYVTVEDAELAQQLWDNREDTSVLPEDQLRRSDVDKDGALTHTDIKLIRQLAKGEKKNRVELSADYLRGQTGSLDLWGNPYQVTLIPDGDAVSIEFRSAGRDQKYGTDDDIFSVFSPKYNTGAVRF